MTPLSDDRALVLTAEVDAVPAERALALLSEEERARHDRFLFEKDKAVHRVAHAMVRHVLSGLLGVEPGALRFVKNAWGRPELAMLGRASEAREAEAEPRGARIRAVESPRPLRFNLSHTRGLAALIVTRAHDCGVDVEAVDRRVDPIGLGARVFAPSEHGGVIALSGEAQRERFFALWTLKEAYIKARGMGLALPLRDFAFELDEASGEIARGDAISFTESLMRSSSADPGGTWHFARWAATDVHRVALAVRTETPTPIVIERRAWTLD